jgi:hypothetical protein
MLKKLIWPAALVLFASTVFAQSPLVGTWKLDNAKTKYETGPPPKDLTLVIEEKGDSLQVTVTGTNADGSPLNLKYTVPEKGGAGQVQDGKAYDGVTSKRLSAYVRDNTYMKDGKKVSTRHVVVSKDGKMMRSSVKGNNALGNPIAGTDVFEKQ